MTLIITCIEPIAGTVNIMISQVLPFSVNAHGLKSMAKVRARKFLEIELIKAASSLSLKNEKRSHFF